MNQLILAAKEFGLKLPKKAWRVLNTDKLIAIMI